MNKLCVGLQIALDSLYLVSFCAQLVLTAFHHFHGPLNGHLPRLCPQRLLVAHTTLMLGMKQQMANMENEIEMVDDYEAMDAGYINDTKKMTR